MRDKYIFLDRDGVINKDPGGWTEYGYVTRWEDFHFLPHVLIELKRFKEHGYKGIVVSNQQGVGKGYFAKEVLDDITKRMLGLVENEGGSIAGVYYCTHREEESCLCRKPKSGLFIKAQKDLSIESFEDKFFVGDTQRDIQAGKGVGLKTILVLSGKSSRKDVDTWIYKPDYICDDFCDVSNAILGKHA